MRGTLKALVVFGGVALALFLYSSADAQRWRGEGYTDNVTETWGDGGTGSISGSCNDLSSTSGLDLSNMTGYAVGLAIMPPDGGSPSNSYGPSSAGGGSLLCCVRRAVNSGSDTGAANTQMWMRCKTSLDITSIPSGQVSYFEPDFSTGVGGGRVDYVPSAVTSDGGTFLRVTIVGQKGPRAK